MGPFRLRIPFIHIKFRTAEFLQGMIISGATAFAGIPIAMGMGLSFEEGVALSFISGTLIAAAAAIKVPEINDNATPSSNDNPIPIAIGMHPNCYGYGIII